LNTSRGRPVYPKYQRQIHPQFLLPTGKVVQQHFVVPSQQLHMPEWFRNGIDKNPYGNNKLFIFDELIEPLAQIRLHVAPQPGERKTVAF
jgi:hypothetical protein